MSEIVSWKRAALQKLLEIEGGSSVYSHQKNIIQEERPSIFYTIAEKRLPMNEVIAMVKSDFATNLPEGHFSNGIVELTLKLLEKSKDKIDSLSSLFVAIETNWGVIDPRFERRKFYDHYHPPRGDRNEISTLSYFAPLYLENKVDESFNYCDLSKMNLAGKPYSFWKNNNPEKIAEDFIELSQKTLPADWKKILFPENGALEIAFDSFYNLHNLSDLSGNLFLTIVINDVELKTKMTKGGMLFTYLSPNEIE
ncbi:hypothetical protein C0V70_17515 [Bacteriovorax stolpii]|uniref:Uncharacterized protein n=1 Tax=Bacteriovorax stolpii TaxID=960 RepID=A0A2K9NWH2_BACTC|nr:hypothetical protein [Bacteriovorax stolpii]AUN99869.1 hypothetical protein C0V70_17515 [Bacteriovorax stolpii]TDP54238.1 hypothetical protein C8D79_1531 [Bacteriovorax stolpii]